MVFNPAELSSGISSSQESIYLNGTEYQLSEQVIKNIEIIIGFQAQQEQKLSLGDRLIEKIAAFFGKSEFLYLQLFFFVGWAICSDLAPQLLPFNLPEFDLEGMGIDIASLLIGTGVLIQQNRQDKVAEQRSHLMLQMNLLTEQKIAKLIGLIEELRQDLPDIRDRHDWEAQIMQKATNPQLVLNILQENLEQSIEEHIKNQ